MINKICVYAICKNEMQWIDRWLDNMKEADYIVVLDTGSTDGSFEKLSNDPRATKVEQEIINPWRFDVARNESMKLCPEDANILVCTDFDELFDPGWGSILRANWKEDYDRCHYTYAWSHNALGEPQDVFKYDKIHNHNYYWKFPVHEVLCPYDTTKPEEILDAGTHIFLHHYQDTSKPRGNYFDLLQLSVAENPEESHVRMLLAREYFLKKDYDIAMQEYLNVLSYPDVERPERLLVKEESTARVADLYFLQDDYQNALIWYTKAIKLDPTHREPYFCMGDVYNAMQLYTLSEAIIKAGFENSVRHYDWTERKDFWLGKGNLLLAISQYNQKKYDSALENAKKALKHDPDNVLMLKIAVVALEKKVDKLTIKKV